MAQTDWPLSVTAALLGIWLAWRFGWWRWCYGPWRQRMAHKPDYPGQALIAFASMWLLALSSIWLYSCF